jgi:hypothetical protein
LDHAQALIVPFIRWRSKVTLWAGAPGDDISCADIIVEDDGTGWEQNGNWSESSAGNGSVRVDSTNGQQIIGLNKTWIEGGINAIETHVGEKGGTSTLIVPLVYRKTLNGQSANPQDNMAWESYTGVIVHNLGDTEANVTIYIYDQNGLYTTSFTDDIPANSPHGYNTRYGGYIPTANLNSLGYNFVGSMYVTSNTGEPLIGLVDVGLETDAIYYYNADW